MKKWNRKLGSKRSQGIETRKRPKTTATKVLLPCSVFLAFKSFEELEKAGIVK